MSWEMVKLGDVCDTSSGGTPSSNNTNYYGGDIPWIKSGDLRENTINHASSFITEEGLKDSSAKWVEPKAVLLAMYGATVGRLAILNIAATTNQAVCSIRPKEDNLAIEYIYYLLRSKVSIFLRQAVGGAQPNISQTIIKETVIPFPPLPEQQRIADILDKAEAITQKREQALALCDELLRATFLDMFGDPVSNPKGWEVTDLERATNKITDGTHHSPPITDEGIPYITAKHLKKDGLRFFDNPWYISLEDHKNIFSRCNPEKGDVLYIKDGATTGIAAINEYDFEFSMLSSLALIKCDEDILNPYFLCSMLNNDRNKQKLISNMGGAAIKRLTLTKIKKIEIIVPPIDLQQKFSEIVEKVNSIKARIQRTQELPLFDALSQQAFKGELTQ